MGLVYHPVLRTHPLLPSPFRSPPPPLQQIATATASFPPPPNPTTMAETLSLRGTLEGHSGWVTSIATPIDPNSDMIVSASR